jgi:tRNA A-37 threonylcarbamoyl transferase component Bud32
LRLTARGSHTRVVRICPKCGTRFEQALQYCPHDGTQTYEATDQGEPPEDPMLGRVIDGRYRVERQIGEGGMGVVYLATHTTLNKKLALKVLRGDNSKDADVVQRFMQEAQAATSIGHANIIDISDFGRLPDGAVYFVMEYLDGMALTDLMKQSGSVEMQEALHVVRQMASALEAAHRQGIVHRDLKPDNVYLVTQSGDDRFVKVLDFGIAKVGGAASKLTKTGMVFGTPHYMSPEQAAGHTVDARTDIYALGIIMYEMFSGRVPFDADTFMGILSKHMFEAPMRPTDSMGGELGPVEGVILRCLEKNPDHRYQSMAELITDLDTLSAGGAVAYLPAGSASAPPGAGDLANALEPSSASHPSMPGYDSGVSGGGTSTFALLALGLVALLVVGGGVGTMVFLFTADGEAAGEVAAAPRESDSDPEVPAASAPPVEPEAIAAVPAAPEETMPAAPAPPELRRVHLDTSPSGAEVLVDDVMVGNAPLDLPLPTEGAQTVTLRLPGHVERQVRLNSDSQDELTITLEPQRVARPSGSRRPPPPPPAVRPAPRPSAPLGGNEVVDPWAD